MVGGLDKFKEKFEKFGDCYTIIGGTACDILMSEADMDFRATKDIDMILILEDSNNEFVQAFWDFIKEGGYRYGWKNNDKVHFYRFTEPQKGYPIMIELFSRQPNYQLANASHIIPIHIADDISSLSAILLDSDFYNFMLKGRRSVDGITILSAEYIIPFKMCAWLDLKKRKQNGEHVNDRDYKKHKNDVFRLFSIINPDAKIPTDGTVKNNIIDFIKEIKKEPVDTKQFDLNESMEEILDILETIYL